MRAHDEGSVPGGRSDNSTMHFLVAWAEARAGERPAPALSLPEVAMVTRRVALLLGDRPLRGVTLGDLAGLPSLLIEGGMDPSVARSACRELGAALRAAIGDWSSGKSAAAGRSGSRRAGT